MAGNATLRTMQAVGSKVLPVQPGDYLYFKVTDKRFLVIAAGEQSTQSGTSVGAGQRVAGISTRPGAYWWEDFFLDWSGLNSLWTIHRT